MSGGSWSHLYMAELAPRSEVYREASSRDVGRCISELERR